VIKWAVTKGRETDLLSRWVAELIWPGQKRDFGNCQGLAVVEGDQLIAGMIYHNWEPASGVVEISGASTTKRWLNRETLRVMFHIPFRDWECQAVVMRVSDHDKPLHRILKAYGFEHYRIPRLRGRDEGENVFILTDDAWRTNRFNKKG
jgi:RimJ/RimL family protein N-acetyltransferase